MCIDLELTAYTHNFSVSVHKPWGNFAEKNPKYQQYLDENLLHCGDANNVNYLMNVWTKEMKRPGAPPLKVVVDDGSHEAAHMAQSVMFWLPRIEPGGLLFVEDIQPSSVANPFTTQFLPQLMKVGLFEEYDDYMHNKMHFQLTNSFTLFDTRICTIVEIKTNQMKTKLVFQHWLVWFNQFIVKCIFVS